MVNSPTIRGRSVPGMRAPPRIRLALILPILLVVFVLAVPIGSFGRSISPSLVLPRFDFGAPSGSSHALAAPAAPAAAAAPAGAKPAASSVFNPPCYKIDTHVCVSIKYYGETNIVPPSNGTVCGARPNATTGGLPLIIKSQYPLNWTGNHHNGTDSPIALNVTGALWNGDPYYSVTDNTVWHANGGQWWLGPTYTPQNQSYPWWYEVNLTMKASNGAPNFFPGMTITWWIALTYNVSFRFIHHESPHFQCTFSGAWPYSPYRGAAQYAGGSAVWNDVNLTFNPRQPNWNDSVQVVLNTTQADARPGINASIQSAYLDIFETAPTGALISSGTIPFPVSIGGNNGFGVVTSTAVIPPSYSQVAGANVSYRITIFDMASDQLVTPWLSYAVNGNGSFASGVFTDDLAIATSPTSIVTGVPGTILLNPGQIANVTVTSRNPSTAINSAQIAYWFGYPRLGEVQSGIVTLTRVTSTVFTGHLPGLPLGAVVNFSVYAWDFNQRLEASPLLEYATPDLGTFLPLIPGNATFFYVFVYDNGSQKWVDGAKVQIVGPHSFFNIVTNTTLGVAYPNQTGQPQVPLLIPANRSYTISVNDPWFVPASARNSSVVSTTILALHTMDTMRGVLAIGPSYVVVQEGDSVLFFLNASAPLPPSSPPVANGVPALAIIGMIATIGGAIPLAIWWREIRARRKEEEKRVTL